MFDGTAKLPSKDFKPIPSKQAAVLTGAGGQVADLKTSEPDLKKLSPVTEFSLSGTKLSGGTPDQAATKQSPSLLASAKSALSPQKASAAGTTGANSVKASANDIVFPEIPDIKIPDLTLDDPAKCAEFIQKIKQAENDRNSFSIQIERLPLACDTLPDAATIADCKEKMIPSQNKLRNHLRQFDDVIKTANEIKEKSCKPETQKCPTECKCSPYIKDCADINSGACLNVCNGQRICISKMKTCDVGAGWKDTYWRKPGDKPTKATSVFKRPQTGKGYYEVTYDYGSYIEVWSGGSLAWRCNNFGNLNSGMWDAEFGVIGYAGQWGRYDIFPDYQTGYNAAWELLKKPLYKDLDIKRALHYFAPSFENDTKGYLKFLESRGFGPTTTIASLNADPERKKAFFEAIKERELFKEGTITRKEK